MAAVMNPAPERQLLANKKSFAWGAVQGRVSLPSEVLTNAERLARDYYAQAEAEEFCGDEVGDILVPDWMPAVPGWFPHEEVRALGFVRAASGNVQMLATVGVDAHVDGITGPSFILVLHNDGLTFRQGRQRHKTEAGQWFIFDDRQSHEVLSTRLSTTYLVLSIPLVQWSSK